MAQVSGLQQDHSLAALAKQSDSVQVNPLCCTP